MDDDDLAQALGLNQRQQANAICRQLAQEGLVKRLQVQGKLHNFWAGEDNQEFHAKNTSLRSVQSIEPKASLLWYWEGCVQAKTIEYLVSQKFSIVSSADTASRQRGVDIIAERNGRQLWISAKGYPQATARTLPTLQAAHWFKEAIFDLLVYRAESKTNKLGIALPDFPRYHSLAAKINWLKPVTDFVFFWVRENGEVIVE